MLRLPTILIGDCPTRLPLNNEAALGVANALLCDQPVERERQFLALLRDEPSLALWCVCRGGEECHSLRELSEWISRRAIANLQWDDHELVDICNAGVVQPLERWADLATSSAAATLEAPSKDNEHAYFSALLSRATDWFLITIPDVDGPKLRRSQINGILPSWLQDAISRRHSTTPKSKLRVTSSDFLKLNAIRQRWLTSEAEPAICLPALTRRLAHLQDLEINFAERLESEKLASLKELAYGASHEINNPLANIATRAQTLLRDERDPERRRKLATINAQAFRAHEMISDMMLFARPPQLKMEPIDLVALLSTVVSELAADAELQNTIIALTKDSTPLVMVVDREQMAVVVKTLCKNALEAIGQGGSITIEVQERADHEPHVEICVRDTGPGISPEVRRHLFDPFYSGREAGRGLGFGLSKSWRIVTLHGGKITVESELGNGTTFVVRLPHNKVAARENAGCVV